MALWDLAGAISAEWHTPRACLRQVRIREERYSRRPIL